MEDILRKLPLYQGLYLTFWRRTPHNWLKKGKYISKHFFLSNKCWPHKKKYQATLCWHPKKCKTPKLLKPKNCVIKFCIFINPLQADVWELWERLGGAEKAPPMLNDQKRPYCNKSCFTFLLQIHKRPIKLWIYIGVSWKDKT